MEENPTVSVIIPTHNRCSSLIRCLKGLINQSYPFDLIEVIVVSDGCTDETVSLLSHYRLPFSFYLVEQPQLGAATARNTGEAKAKGDLLIFLDDDIAPSAHFIASHVNSHNKHPDRVVIGYLSPIVDNKERFFNNKLWSWWEAAFHNMRQEDHRFSFNNLFSGNFSISKSLFNQVGRFDPDFQLHEDYELGARLIKRDVEMVFSPEAWGYHYDKSDLDRMIGRKFDEGRAGIQMVRKHPELFSWIDSSFFRSRKGTVSPRIFLLIFPVFSDFLFYCLRQLLGPLEWLKMRRYWNLLQNRIFTYWYTRGVASELPHWYSVQQFLNTLSLHPDRGDSETKVDLKEGLENIMSELDQTRPHSLRVYFGNWYLGYIPSEPGAERLKGKHLKKCLVSKLEIPLLIALAMNDMVFDKPEPKKIKILTH